jgi:hypothetical protein
MRGYFSIILRIFIFSTETVVVRHLFRIFILTLRTAPIQNIGLLKILITIGNPCFNAFEMHVLETLPTTPNTLSILHDL